MNDERKAIYAFDAVRVEDARMHLQGGNDLEIVIFEQIVAVLAGGGNNHRIDHVRAKHMAVHYRRAIDHHLHATLALVREPLGIDGGRDNRLAGKILEAETIELMYRRHDHTCRLQCLAQHEVRPLF